MIDSLDERVAAVTGAASGLGEAMARRFAGAGMRLALADVDAVGLARVADELSASGASVCTMRVDVRDAAEVAAFADLTFDAYGTVHLLCNNAGVAVGGRAWDLTADDWNWVLGVDLWGVIHGIRAFVPRMIDGGEPGHVVNTGSMTSLLAMPYLAAYGTAKAAVASLSESLFLDLRAEGADIGVSVLCPGHVETRIQDSARNRPADLADSAPRRARRRSAEGVQPRLSAADVADSVVDAVLHRRFWILTHREYASLIESRAAGISTGAPPVVPPVW